MTTRLPNFLKLAPVIVHAPGLFTNLAKGTPDLLVKLDYTVGDLRFRFIGPQLGANELRVLQGLVALAGPQNPPPRRRTTSDEAPLDDVDVLLNSRASVKTTYNELAHVIGASQNSGSSTAMIRGALERLYSLAVFVSQSADDSTDFEAGHLLTRMKSSDPGSVFAGVTPHASGLVTSKSRCLNMCSDGVD